MRFLLAITSSLQESENLPHLLPSFHLFEGAKHDASHKVSLHKGIYQDNWSYRYEHYNRLNRQRRYRYLELHIEIFKFLEILQQVHHLMQDQLQDSFVLVLNIEQ